MSATIRGSIRPDVLNVDVAWFSVVPVAAREVTEVCGPPDGGALPETMLFSYVRLLIVYGKRWSIFVI